MRKLIQVQEIDGEGLESFLGERILIMCAGYFYEGKLIGVNSTFVKLEDPSIVYTTGVWTDKAYSDIQKMGQKEWYISTSLIESFGKSKNE